MSYNVPHKKMCIILITTIIHISEFYLSEKNFRYKKASFRDRFGPTHLFHSPCDFVYKIQLNLIKSIGKTFLSGYFEFGNAKIICVAINFK